MDFIGSCNCFTRCPGIIQGSCGMAYDCIARSRKGTSHLALGGRTGRRDIDELRLLPRACIHLSTLGIDACILGSRCGIRLDDIDTDRCADTSF